MGTSLTPLTEENYAGIAEMLKKNNIRYVFVAGGNGTMDACGRTCEACRTIGFEAQAVGIPKSIDNDIAVTGRALGFGSAA